MDIIDKVKHLITLMNDNELAEIEIQEKSTKIRVKKSGSEISHTVSTLHPPQPVNNNPELEDGNVRLLGAKESDKYPEITAPMVGTFYRSSSPGSKPYADVGDKVDQDTVVCIIEAMKIMNEVKAGMSGEIVEVLAKDSEPVEYGQPLFHIKPAS